MQKIIRKLLSHSLSDDVVYIGKDKMNEIIQLTIQNAQTATIW